MDWLQPKKCTTENNPFCHCGYEHDTYNGWFVVPNAPEPREPKHFRFVPLYDRHDNPWAETETMRQDARMAEDWRA